MRFVDLSHPISDEMTTYPSDPDVNFQPEDQDVWNQQADEQDGHFWDLEELSHHASTLATSLQAIDGLEFKLNRLGPKEAIVEFLNEIPEFYNDISDRIFEEDWEKFDIYTPTFNHQNLSSDELQSFLEKAFFKYYFRSSWFFKHFKSLKNLYKFKGVGERRK